MEKDGLILPIFPEFNEQAFKGSVDELFDYIIKNSKKAGKGIEANLTKGKTKLKQFFVPMADGTYSSVLAKLTKSGAISTGKGSLKVTGGIYGPQIERFRSLTSLQDYNSTIKKSKTESVYFQKLQELANRFENIKKDPSLESLKKLQEDILGQKTIANEQGYITTTADALGTSVDEYIEKYKKIGDELDSVIYKSSSFYDKQKMDIDRITKKLEEAKQQFRDYKAEGKDTRAVEKNIKNLNKELEKLGRQPPISGIRKFLNTIKRVGFYRVARNLFRFIEQGFGQATTNLINIDNQTNKTLSSLSTSAEKLSSSIALTILPILEIVEPFISKISNSISEFANKISMANANMKGLSEYVKISDEYMKDLRSTANSFLLSFDKFESADMQTSPYTKAFISEEDKKDVEKYTGIIEKIRGILSKVIQFIEYIGSAIIHIFTELEPYLDDIINVVLFVVNSITHLIVLLGKIVGWIGKIIDTKGELLALVGVLTAIASSVLLITGHPVKAVMTMIAGMTTMTPIMASLFADGGLPQQGTLFYAGEAGAELVTTMPSGQTGVTNIAQFKQAMVEALYECSDVFQNANNSEVVLNLDGAEIARSKRFVSEVNRKNSGLNIR